MTAAADAAGSRLSAEEILLVDCEYCRRWNESMITHWDVVLSEETIPTVGIGVGAGFGVSRPAGRRGGSRNPNTAISNKHFFWKNISCLLLWVARI